MKSQRVHNAEGLNEMKSQRSGDAMRRQRTKRAAAGVAIALSTVALSAACGNSPSAGGVVSSAANENATASAFASKFQSFFIDYELSETPADLLAGTDLVVRGQLASVSQGPAVVFTEKDPNADVNSIVLSVQVSDVARGALPEGSNGTIYVVIPMASLPLNEYESALPVGEDTVLYLNEDRSPDSYYRDPSVGRPGKQPLWVLASPQGFVVEQGDTSVQIFDTQKFSGTVDEFLPTSDSFPEPSKGTEQTG